MPCKSKHSTLPYIRKPNPILQWVYPCPCFQLGNESEGPKEKEVPWDWDKSKGKLVEGYSKESAGV